MYKRVFKCALAAGVALSLLAPSVIAAEANLKAGYFISNKKSLTRQAFDQFVDHSVLYSRKILTTMKVSKFRFPITALFISRTKRLSSGENDYLEVKVV